MPILSELNKLVLKSFTYEGFSLSKMINFCFREKCKLAVFKISKLDEKEVERMELYQLPLNYISKKELQSSLTIN